MTTLSKEREAALLDLGLLVLRVGSGALMLTHGIKKLSGWAEMSSRFPDPLGVGSAPSLAMAIFAEVFCAIAVMVGIKTRAVVVPLIITMLVAALLVHGHDPFRKKELALVYLVPFIALAFTGAGRLSLDGWLDARSRKA